MVELDINPLLADRGGVIALDARLRIAVAASPALERLAIRPYPQEWEQWVTWQDAPLLLRPIKLHLEHPAAAGHPQEALRGQGGGPVRQFGEAVVDQEKAHGNPWVTSPAS